MNSLKNVFKDKKGQGGGVVTSTVFGIGALIIGTIVILVIVSTLNDANLLTTGSDEATAVDNLTANFTSGIGKVADKIPDILTIVAVVFLLGALVLLWFQARRMGIGGQGGSL